MRLESVRVIHWLKADLSPEAHAERVWERIRFVPGALYLNSCQRVLFVCTKEQLQGFQDSEDYFEDALAHASLLSGTQAYFFLLKVATGLESQVVGETDIFGQLKQAWKRAQEQPAGLHAEVDFWARKLFEDAKEIRSQYLENLGGGSYGSLVRMLLKERQAKAEGPVLLVGAGLLAQSVAPFLGDSEIWLWNRSPEKLAEVRQEIERCTQARVTILESEEQEADAWRKAATVVVCIPVDEAADARRIALYSEGGEARVLLHLGAQAPEAGEWNQVEGACFLDSIFELQKSQGETRSLQVRQAIRACDERAKLRSLGGSVSIAHGWEDLAVFA